MSCEQAPPFLGVDADLCQGPTWQAKVDQGTSCIQPGQPWISCLCPEPASVIAPRDRWRDFTVGEARLGQTLRISPIAAVAGSKSRPRSDVGSSMEEPDNHLGLGLPCQSVRLTPDQMQGRLGSLWTGEMVIGARLVKQKGLAFFFV